MTAPYWFRGCVTAWVMHLIRRQWHIAGCIQALAEEE